MTLLHAIERFCDEHRIAEGRFGSLAAGDNMLVAEIRQGRKIGASLENRLRTFMRENRGKELRAPSKQEPDVPRKARGDTNEPATQAVACDASAHGSDALLKALWRSHPGILRNLAAQGRNVVHVEARG